MEEKIFEIVKKVQYGEMSIDSATAELLLLFSVSGSLVAETDLVSFGSYLLSAERNHYVKDKKSVHHADIENWKHLKKNIGNQ